MERSEHVERLEALARELYRETGKSFPVVLWTGDAPVLQVGDAEVACADEHGNLDLWRGGQLVEPDVAADEVLRLARESVPETQKGGERR